MRRIDFVTAKWCKSLVMSGDELQELKRAERARARHMLSRLSPKRREQAALDAGKMLRFSSVWAACDCLLAYMALGAELDCAFAIQLALKENKKVFIPKVFDGSMVFFRIFSVNGPFEKGQLGIREPVARGGESGTEGAVWGPGRGLSLALTPGLLFDESGGRLGRGGGYFDRFIRKIRLSEAGVAKPIFIGYAYDEQVVEKVPRDSGDELLDGVLTDLRFLRHPDG